MTDMQLSSFKNDCNNVLNSYKANVSALLGYIASAKNISIENADIKKDLDVILEDIQRQLKDLYDDMDISL